MSGVFGPVGTAIPLTAASAPPAAYIALLAWFGGDAGALVAFLADQIAYYSDSDAAVDLLLAADTFGTDAEATALLEAGEGIDPASAAAQLGFLPVGVAATWGVGISAPAYAPSYIAVAGSIPATAPNIATSF